ncbi:MAG: DUF4139 domain-containing protein [Spirochaetaceae bacterium]|jgi:hypothetical protein|nr:DUF4139 domain-containing protein [Spirochaetaceae bacterium]
MNNRKNDHPQGGPLFRVFTGLAFFAAGTVFGQTPPDRDLSLRKISLFSSGVGYFEHSGTVEDNGEIAIPFNLEAVNDALKSLVIHDPGSGDLAPSVLYASETTLARTLKSLSVDLSENPGIARILDSLKGAELELRAPASMRGRVLGVEFRSTQNPRNPEQQDREPWLSILTAQGIQTLALREISSFSFTDPVIQADLERALDLIMASRGNNTRNLTALLPGSGRRQVGLSYIIPSPVWKVSYRLDLNQDQPVFQGWAIVDNDSDTDWNEVELSLVTGRPVSFIQNLYAPYYLTRPVLPLAIAGIAQARSYAPGFDRNDAAAFDHQEFAEEADMEVMKDSRSRAVPAPAQRSSASVLSSRPVNAAQGQAAGYQFSFTIKRPVSLPRQQSAMFPMVGGPIQAEKILVLDGMRARQGQTNPAISAELTNTTGMKLPAGPITVFDGGTYGGDSLIEFFPENEKRLISYGDDLSVIAQASLAQTSEVNSVVVAEGIMTITRKVSYIWNYLVKNTHKDDKTLIIEHPITAGTVLKTGQAFSERTDALYRFRMTLPADKELAYTVTEETPLSERIELSRFTVANYLGYTSNTEIPEHVRNVLGEAMRLKRRAEDAKSSLTNLEARRTRLESDQDRVRRNLEAAGNETQQGMDYLRRMTEIDREIDSLNTRIESAQTQVRESQREYEQYLSSLSLR